MIFYEISAVLLFLVYIPGIAPGVIYAISRFRSEFRRNKTVEGICLSLFLSSALLSLLNIILLIIYEG